MPCTWTGWSHPTCEGVGKSDIPNDIKTNPTKIEQYGGYGTDGDDNGKSDHFNLYDAIYTAGNYLNSSGFSSNIRQALYPYNHDDSNVDEVIHYAELFATTTGAIP
ncbi:hypothetical protein V1503_23695 [Bacillus sp. SCS-151]|uniref:hypothetical protein n=1 Tax=Nanhaiella sioensis TaxID=3115293 RepID=UPI00397B776E